MAFTTERSQSKSAASSSWGKVFTQRIQEFPLTPLTVLSGELPANLRGSLYRNGPALFERQGEQIAHWFDGDGAVLGIHFDGANAAGVYRMVDTAGYRAEEASRQFQLGGYGRRSSGPFWSKSAQQTKNAANTSVLATSDRLLALWEGGQPHALDRHSLETLGLDDLQGLGKGQTFSAHPKVDAQTGEIYNFGITFGQQTQLHLYRCDRSGQIRQQGMIPLDRIPMIHDFVLAGPYLLFLIAPVYLNPLPLLLGMQSYSEALRWQPKRGTQILVVDRDTLTPIRQTETDPWFQWHFGNGYIDLDGQVVVDLVRYPDFQTNQFLQEVPSGHPQTMAPGTLWRLHMNPKTAAVTTAEPLSDRTCEFPTVNPHHVGQPSRYTYVAARSDQAPVTDLFNAIACYDHERGEVTLADLGKQRYPSEPIFAPDLQHPDQGWILSVVYDGDHHTSEVWIFQSQALSAGPVCRLALPQVIAHSFHGTWSATA